LFVVGIARRREKKSTRIAVEAFARHDDSRPAGRKSPITALLNRFARTLTRRGAPPFDQLHKSLPKVLPTDKNRWVFNGAIRVA